MSRPSWRIHTGVALALVLAVGTGCGTRLDKAAIVAAHNGQVAAGQSGDGVGGVAAGGSFDQGAVGSGAAATATPESTPAAGVAAGPSPAGGGTVSGSSGNSAQPGTAGRAASSAAAGSSGARTPGAPAASSSSGGSAAPASKSAAGAASTPGAATPGAPKPGAPAPGAPAAASGTPILVGAVGHISGIVGAAVGPAAPALRAWAASVNATGGIKGHAVKLFIGDDGGDPARNRQLAQEMVERDKVVAFVMDFSPLGGQGMVDYVTGKKIPVTGDSGAGQWFYQSPVFFPQMSTGAVWVRAMIYAAASETIPQGKKKLAILNCQEAQFCVDADKMWPGLAPKVGYDLVFRRQASLAQPDYTAECIAARNAGAEVFGLAMDGNAIGRIASSCARANFHPIYFIHHSAMLLEHAKDPNLEGIIVPLPTRPYFDNVNPVVAAYQKALATYSPGNQPKPSSFAGWAAGQLFQAAANKAPDPTTTAGIFEGLYALNGETLGDVTHPLKFNRDNNATEILCYYVVRGAQGNWAKTPGGSNLSCPKV